jgi:pSer/pThr/pTyr-binding forkhead associated (FHA) protein
MPQLVLQFEGRVLKECSVGLMLTIGRLPDNTVVIDNPAVSSHHAAVFRAGDDYILEDLESTNGTFVNSKRVVSHTLQTGDVVLIGKHELVFDRAGGERVVSDDGKLHMSKLDNTVFLDTEQHKALLAKLNDVQHRTEKAVAVPTATAQIAVLRVLAGGSGQSESEYGLAGHTSLIGKADTSLVRLSGWFKPDMAVAITRNTQGYVATLLGGKTLINGQPLRGRQGLKDGDVLDVSGLTLEFRVTS